ncbi:MULTISPECIES: hypothetical protein [unclassified Acinetobacter]|uniref:hypothetical protein n=1 Tax=unclassified Acinetobacter TaxID=196816 RepID=UPI0018EBD3EE|nr:MULTISPECIES: hypothetical protein [unclassified Acinetobacter]MBJ6351117.1 hypothetical protein [Acinetobacter sp. c1]MBM0956743.1 hypothetical protein [Acinetobacter sp. C13]
MKQYLDSIKLSLETKNYFGAIALSLTLPDICASIESDNNETNRDKYCAWFEKYLAGSFPRPGNKVLLSAQECYAARCSFLHQGTNITQHQKILKGIDKAAPSVSFMTNTMISGIMRHDQKVIIDINFFCLSMIVGVENWVKDHNQNEIVKNKILALPIVHVGTSSLPNVQTIEPR